MTPRILMSTSLGPLKFIPWLVFVTQSPHQDLFWKQLACPYFLLRGEQTLLWFVSKGNPEGYYPFQEINLIPI